MVPETENTGRPGILGVVRVSVFVGFMIYIIKLEKPLFSGSVSVKLPSTGTQSSVSSRKVLTYSFVPVELKIMEGGSLKRTIPIGTTTAVVLGRPKSSTILIDSCRMALVGLALELLYTTAFSNVT